jgi:hypothetical protein
MVESVVEVAVQMQLASRAHDEDVARAEQAVRQVPVARSQRHTEVVAHASAEGSDEHAWRHPPLTESHEQDESARHETASRYKNSHFRPQVLLEFHVQMTSFVHVPRCVKREHVCVQSPRTLFHWQRESATHDEYV